MSIDRGMDKEDVVHIHKGMLLSHKKEIMPFAATWWRRKWHPTPVFSPGRFHGQRSLADYSP